MITLRIGPFWVDQKNFHFSKFFESSNRWGTWWPILSILANFDLGILKNGVRFWLPVFCVCFISLLSTDWPNITKIKVVVPKIFSDKNPKNAFFGENCYLWVKFSPRRRQVGKNLTTHSGKEIFRTFRISNQIFGSSNRSPDKERSLDTTFGRHLLNDPSLRSNNFWTRFYF